MTTKHLLIGSTGMIGTRVAAEARSRGIEITEATRSGGEGRIALDVTDTAALAEAAEGHDAIISAISPPRDGSDPSGPLVAAGRSIVKAARETGVSRVLFVGGAGSLKVGDSLVVDQPWFPSEVRGEALAHADLLEVLRTEADDIEWSYLSPAAIIGYGSSRALEAVANSGPNVEPLHRYLFEGDNAPMLSDGYGEQLKTIDARISGLSGMPMSDVYRADVQQSLTEQLESGLTADAATLIHDQGPAAEMELARRLQELRFVEGVSAQNRSAVIDVLVDLGVDPQTAKLVGTPEVREAASQMSATAIAAMAAAGAVGVPAIIRHTEAGSELLHAPDFFDDPESILNTAPGNREESND